jgi:uncharacterized protein (DUF2236 family)
LLTWVHVAEVSSFLAAHVRYCNPALPVSEQDRYYDEIALIAERLGATNVPRSAQQIADYLEGIRPQLLCDHRSAEIMDVLFHAPAPSSIAKPFGSLMMRAGVDLLPPWATAQLGLEMSEPQRHLVRAGVKRSAPLLRWAVRTGAHHRARKRMGLPPLR